MIYKNLSIPKSAAFRFSLLTVLLLLLINLLSLPSLLNTFTSSTRSTKSYNLIDYRHPLIPQVNPSTPPILQAQNFILIDHNTNTILASKNAKDRIFPASITKLATALTALNIYPLEEVVTVSQPYQEGKVMNLQIGERVTVKNLISALLVYSANDAAFNLASHHPQGINGFVGQMNLIASKYQLNQTHFTNYDGIHQPEHYSTVHDLAQLGRISLKNPVLLEAVKSKSITITDLDGKIIHQLDSTNELLNIAPEIEGLKTGWTPEAGGCFLGLINLYGHYLISVVAQSPDRFADTQQLIDWSKSHLSWQTYQP